MAADDYVWWWIKTITDLERVVTETTKIVRTAQKEIYDEDRMYKPR
jgi:hypothetical protein